VRGHATQPAILGAADGVTSIAGVVAGGAGAGVSHTALALTAIGGAAAATVSMGGAEWLSATRPRAADAVAMGVGTLAGGALPALPLVWLSGSEAWLAISIVALVLAVVVGLVRAHMRRTARPVAIMQTIAVLGAGALVGYAAGRL
jgi:VIT1/CCC1 family predicted Fe2+/Mn2+ transporter